MPHTRLHPTYTFDQDRLDQLRALVPEAFADGKIDWDTLRDLLGDAVEDPAVEHFGLSWPGKREARRLASRPSRGALIPVPGEGINEDTTRNIFIEGENLEVLKLLLKSYAGRVKIVYLDPPYNRGDDLIYRDDYAEPLESYLRRTTQADDEGLLVSNPVTSGRYHSNWLNMMYPRLMLARSVLTEDGVLFVSIGEHEVHHLRQLINEVFGEGNFVATIVWQKSKRGDSKLIAQLHEYILVAVKNRQEALANGIWRKPKEGAAEVLAHYNQIRNQLGNVHEAISTTMRDWYASLPKQDPRRKHMHYNFSDERGLYFADNFAGPDDGRKSRPRYDIIHPVTGKPCKKPSTGWRWEERRTMEALSLDPPLIHFGPDETTIPCRKTYLIDASSEPFNSVFYRDGRSATLEVESMLGPGVMDYPKNVEVLCDLFTIIPDRRAIIMDFFAGSSSTAQAVVHLNQSDQGQRQFILVQIPEPTKLDSRARQAGYENMAQVGKTRIRRFIAEVYDENRVQFELAELDLGFRVYRLDHSHFKPWTDYSDDNAAALQAHFDAFESPLVDGWKPDDLLVEIMLIEGFPLDSTITRQPQFTANDVRLVESDFHEHRLWVCLDQHVEPGTASALAMAGNDVFICLDNALDDEMKLRLSDGGNLKTI